MLGITMLTLASFGAPLPVNAELASLGDASSLQAQPGQRAQSAVESRQPARRTISIDPKQRWITVHRFESVTLVDSRGNRFEWQAGGPTRISLRSIAPPGFDAGGVWVVVVQPSGHGTN
jgi:hypothetical protein